MLSSTPKVSVIIPTHNRENLFRRALASILGQTFRDIEVIVVENACSDGTAQFLERLTDKRVQVIRLATFVGASAARNAGLKIAQAEFVAFHDDDDVWLPHKLEKQLERLEVSGPSAGLCLTGLIRINTANIECRYARRFFDELDFSTGVGLRDFSVIATPGWLARRKYIDAAGQFDEALPARNDWELALRLRDLCTFEFVDEPLFLQYHTHVTTMRHNDAAYSVALRRIIINHGHRWLSTPEVHARHAEIIGRYEVSHGDRREGRKWLLESLKARARQPNVATLYLLSYLGSDVVLAARKIRQILRSLFHRREKEYVDSNG